ncbi:AAA family ATPase [Kibdelosporangium lantanae]|uniref:AAA family ATPase n=1 Tax=Kibdelosporangium lantanae TaxID=1497396 RepID=A0ABW3M599_9PSEU
MSPPRFVARQRELEQLSAALQLGAIRDRMRIVVVEGVGGIGKTSLVLHWAHANASLFPDGQLFANLRGFDPTSTPVEPHTVLHRFLMALDVDPLTVPVELDAGAALYRSVLADRRVYVPWPSQPAIACRG